MQPDELGPNPDRWGRASCRVLATGLAIALAQAFGLLGPLNDASFGVLGLLCLVCVGVGIRVHRPAIAWPWRLFGVAIALFLVGGVAREVTGGLGDLTSSRSILPDVITLAGYALLCSSLIRMCHARYRARRDGLDALLDAAMASLCALCLAWVFFIGPGLTAGGAPITVRAVLTAYPLMSSFLVAMMARLAFSSGARTGLAFFLLLAAVVSLLVGDVCFMLAELGVYRLDPGLLGAPYAAAQVMSGAAALHPSMRDLTATLPRSTSGPVRARLFTVAAALALPAVVAVSMPTLALVDRLAVTVIVAVLTTTAVVRVMRALTAQMKAQERLAHQATHDDLTGLPNRSYLSDNLPELIASAHRTGRQVAILFLDVDRFKYVNDSLGHAVGDELLVTVANRLQRAMRVGDLVVRIGGDEFVIVLPDIAEFDEALRVAERVRLSFQVPVPVGPSQIVISTSLGVALSSSADHGVNDLMRDADAAMYQAKDAGRNAVAVFDQSMLDRAARRLELEAGLRWAIDRGEIHVHYQPLVTLPTRHVEGFEALMRWHHPVLGDISPVDFIPLAEDTGLIVELGAWILDESCRQLAEWRATMPGSRHLHVSVNVSARQLRGGDFATIVASTLRRWDLPGSALWLELTESLLLDDLSTADGTLDQLRDLGVRLSVDDFGTGYSSLAYLKRFPVDRVKIDRTFVRGLDEADSSDESLTAAIVAMAQALGMSTLAEGIETPTQELRLRQLGVDAAQGYLFARPMPAEQVPDALARLGLPGGPRLRAVPSVA
jgi:diguanylate cyclase (GGDEF)-like protein